VIHIYITKESGDNNRVVKYTYLYYEGKW
jgi:hypothetical protein